MPFLPFKQFLFYYECDQVKQFMHQIAFLFQHSKQALEQIGAALLVKQMESKRNQSPCYNLPENPQGNADLEKLESSVVFRLGLIVHQLLTSRPYQYYSRTPKKDLRIETMYIPINDIEVGNLPQLIQDMLNDNPNHRPTLEHVKKDFKFNFEVEPIEIFNILYDTESNKELQKLLLEEGKKIVEHFQSLQQQ